MAEALQAAVDLAGDLAVRIVEAVHHVVDGATLRRNVDIFHRDEFGHRETVVHLDEVDLFPRIGDAGFLIGLFRGDAGGREIGAVPGIVLRLDAVRHRELQRLDADDVGLAEAARDFRRRDDGASRPVRHAAAVEEAQRLGDDRRAEHLLHRHLVLQMRLGIARAVVVALDRNMRDGALEIFLRDAVLGAIGGGELREIAGRGRVRPPLRIEYAAAALREAAIAGVLELLDAERQRDVGRARGDRIDRAAKGVGAGGAKIFHARDGDLRQAQRDRKRRA